MAAPLTARVYPPADGTANPITVNGRTYTGSLTATITVPIQDARIMAANGWFIDNSMPYSPFPVYLNSQARVMLYGDSIPAASSVTNSGIQTMASRGWINWINAITGFKLYYDDTLNQGLNGETTTGGVARYANAVALNYTKFDWLWIHEGTNDAVNGILPAVTIANLQQMVNWALAAKKVVIIGTILPRASLTSAQQHQVAQVNTAIRAMAAATPNVLAFDCWRDLADPLTGAPLTNYTLDGIHPNMSTACNMAQRFVANYGYIFGAIPTQTQAQWDVYDSVYNPKGSVCPNPTMTGSGGTLTGVTGASPNNFAVTKQLGSFANTAVVASTIAATPGYGCAGSGKLNLAINMPSGLTATEYFQVTSDFTSAGPASGSGGFYAQCELDISGVAGLYDLELVASNWDGAATEISTFNISDGSGFPQTLVPGHYLFKTPVVPLVYSSTPFMRWQMNIGFNCVSNVGTANIAISNAYLRMA